MFGGKKKDDGKRVPDNATLLVSRLKVASMEKLILQSVVDGKPITMDDVAHALDGGKLQTKAEAEAAAKAEAEAEAAKAAQPKDRKVGALARMCTFTVSELDHDFAEFDKNGTPLPLPRPCRAFDAARPHSSRVTVLAGDGTITLNEFIQIMNHNNPEPFEDAELVALFQNMDKDGGGTVCYHEFAEQWAIDREVGKA